MSAAAVEHSRDEPTLLEVADRLAQELVGYRVEVLGGEITVSPSADSGHARSLTHLMLALAPLHGETSEVFQALGIMLPDGPSDFAIPDLCVVEAEIEKHHIKSNGYDPVAFRLVVEITSSNLNDDLTRKPIAYARAGVPVHLVADHKNRRVLVMTDPVDGQYRVRAVHRPGESFALPEPVGKPLKLDVDKILGHN
ncbi:Uma2 family endonuclease [Streptomyces zingiberis]|uniref:Uma2 family endonuclease n=1 Tax=Streptomyces zingiberis TaxID=2053010 RepID=A0ABX1BTT7_9ACTN|nr:Uma2 family endonuclease [Streptomyces zingiberis]NJQ00503.1 Uma2 family endonuclease [Streptomyces zingiberis]